MRKVSTRWHAVTVALNDSSCAAATLCRNQRFLSGEAPRLPLAGCDHPDQCRCVYKHYDDRRSGIRRGCDLGGLSSEPVATNRRLNRGRREKDRR